MRRDRSALLAMGFLAFALVFSSCGGGGDGNGWYSCSYETRHTGCNNYDYTDWEAECVSINSEDYYITPQEVCDNLTENTTTCEAGCCVTSEFRDKTFAEGECP